MKERVLVLGKVIGGMAGALASLALLAAPASASGPLFGWGGDQFGELGAGASLVSPDDTPLAIALPGAIGQPAAAASGSEFTLVVTSAGELYSFGSNGLGQLGKGSSDGEDHTTPTQVKLPEGAGSPEQVAAGFKHSLVLTSTGAVYSFGYNHYGQLGSAAAVDINAHPNPEAVVFAGLTGKIVQIAAGGEESLALSSSGQVYTFGLNMEGELGIGGTDGEAHPKPTVISPFAGQTGVVTQIAAGTEHELAVTSTGQLFGWGRNQSGQLGNKEFAAHASPAQIAVAGAVGGVTHAAAGNEHTVALTGSGQIYTFGSNTQGQLGNGEKSSPVYQASAISLPGATGVANGVAAGEYDSMVVTSTGELFTFGFNSSGQLGNGTTAEGTGVPSRPLLPAGATVSAAVSGADSGDGLAILQGEAGIPVINPNKPIVPIVAPFLSPTVTNLTQSSAVWRIGNRAAVFTRKRPPVGTVFSFVLNEAARLRLTFTRQVSGRRVVGRCVGQTLKNRRRPSCRRTVVTGQILAAGHRGTNRVAFQGRLAGAAKLTPGHYTLSITATNSQQRTSSPARISFAVTR